MEIGLDRLEVGAQGRILQVGVPEPWGKRLEDMGFVPGTKVTCLRKSPLGDPVLYSLRGTGFALRKTDSRRILVETE